MFLLAGHSLLPTEGEKPPWTQTAEGAVQRDEPLRSSNTWVQMELTGRTRTKTTAGGQKWQAGEEHLSPVLQLRGTFTTRTDQSQTELCQTGRSQRIWTSCQEFSAHRNTCVDTANTNTVYCCTTNQTS